MYKLREGCHHNGGRGVGQKVPPRSRKNVAPPRRERMLREWLAREIGRELCGCGTKRKIVARISLATEVETCDGSVTGQYVPDERVMT